jgi:hypothetical protein
MQLRITDCHDASRWRWELQDGAQGPLTSREPGKKPSFQASPSIAPATWPKRQGNNARWLRHHDP